MGVVRTISDMIPALKPEWVDDPDQEVFASRAFAQWARRLITEAECVLAISEFSRREILRYCAEAGVSPAPIAVMRLGDGFGQLPESPPLPRFVPERPFFLCVSTLDVRKNDRLLYEAWCTLAARDPSRCPDLVCVGMLACTSTTCCARSGSTATSTGQTTVCATAWMRSSSSTSAAAQPRSTRPRTRDGGFRSRRASRTDA